MKLLILSLPLHVNYGGILQAFALQNVLTLMGHEVRVLDWPTYIDLPKLSIRWAVYGRRLLGKLLHHSDAIVKWEQQQNRRISLERQFTQPFINKYINRSVVPNLCEVELVDVDGIIVGSDQVWRPCYFKSLWNSGIENAFLSFVHQSSIKKIAYAASFGTDIWEFNELETQKCLGLIDKFDAVSVREDSGVKLCKAYLNTDVLRVPDPTLLFSKEFYIDKFNISRYPRSRGTLMNYILDTTDESKSLIKHLEKAFSVKEFKVNSEIENEDESIENRIQPPVEQWLRGFYDAKLVLTDSFHACVFSILFNKPFFVIQNGARGVSRIKGLLELLGLEKCIINNTSKTPSKMPDIDWTSVNERVAEERERGKAFLLKSLKV